MTARILVVDDIPHNVKLLEANLTAEYFEVVRAFDGPECLAQIALTAPDIVLLDVMMPDMDGFEVCRRIKADPNSAHVPVVMITALFRPADRVSGLEAGADDFLTKPVNDAALLARVRSLVRLKMTMDELRLRESPGRELGIIEPTNALLNDSAGRILLIDDDVVSATWFSSALASTHQVSSEETFEEALVRVRSGEFDLIVVSLDMQSFDGLRLCSHIRSSPQGRDIPILVVVADGDSSKLTRALKLGINDYLSRPVDRNELMARVRTQLRKKRYADQLHRNIQLGLELATTDQLTGLYNRHYLSQSLSNLVEAANRSGKPISLVFMDIDHFKTINDNYGHEAGDQVLKAFASHIIANVRGIDLACRYGGDEFVVAMPDTDIITAFRIAERLRQSVDTTPVKLVRAPHQLCITTSIGIAKVESGSDGAEALLCRADRALYRAKRAGRNRVVADTG